MNTTTNDVQSVIKSCQSRAESDRDVCPTNDYYVYTLLAPGRTHEVFYIGKGRGYRANKHFHPSNKGCNPHKDAVITKYPGCYVEKIAENLSEKQAFALETHLIARAPEGCLTNMTLGGEGISGKPCTDETRAKMSKANKGRTHADEIRAKISKANKGLRCGENSSNVKLTWAMVDEIRERLAAGERLASIPYEYSVSPRTIYDIKNNRTWVRTTSVSTTIR